MRSTAMSTCKITTSHQAVDFEREDIDVCIHFRGRGRLPGVACQRLFGEILLAGVQSRPVPPKPRRRGRRPSCATTSCSARCIRPDDWPLWVRPGRRGGHRRQQRPENSRTPRWPARRPSTNSASSSRSAPSWRTTCGAGRLIRAAAVANGDAQCLLTSRMPGRAGRWP